MSKNYSCSFKFNEISYLHTLLLYYVRRVKEFKSEASSLNQMSVSERDSPELGIHYKCLDSFQGEEYTIPSDNYVFDLLENLKNERGDFSLSTPTFLKKLNDSKKRMNRFHENFESYE